MPTPIPTPTPTREAAAQGGEIPDATTAVEVAAAPSPREDATTGDVPQAPHAMGGGGGLEEGAWTALTLSPSLSLGGCSDPVSVELSMGGDYYRACCDDPDPNIPEGLKLPCVGEKARGGRENPSVPHHPRFFAIGRFLID